MTDESKTTITLEPNWEGTAAYFAHGLMTHSFDRGAKEPIHSFIEQIRYLSLTDPDAVKRILARFA